MWRPLFRGIKCRRNAKTDMQEVEKDVGQGMASGIGGGMDFFFYFFLIFI